MSERLEAIGGQGARDPTPRGSERRPAPDALAFASESTVRTGRAQVIRPLAGRMPIEGHRQTSGMTSRQDVPCGGRCVLLPGSLPTFCFVLTVRYAPLMLS